MKKIAEKNNLDLNKIIGGLSTVIVLTVFFPKIISRCASKIYKSKIF